MKLIVKYEGAEHSEMHFDKGPVYIGRQMGSQVFLADVNVSRQHAVIFATKEGVWMLEDLDSANKTYLNGNAIHKSRIKDGDVIKINGFTIDIVFEKTPEPEKFEQPEKPVHMEDTMIAVRHDVTTVERKIDAKSSHPIELPLKRFGDFDRAASTFCHIKDIEQLHRSLLEVILRQMHAFRAWAAIRKNPEGPMDVQGGREITTMKVNRQDLVMQQTVIDAIENCKYFYVPQLPREMSEGKIRSVVVAPIVRDDGCYGVLYAENSMDHEHYGREDIDYLIMLSILVAPVLEKI